MVSTKKLVTSVLADAEIKWVRDIATQTGTSQGGVLQELIRQEMNRKDPLFKSKLAESRNVLKLQRINDHIMKLEKEKEALLPNARRVAVGV